jgi:cysteinyl-tRNA synthetase
MRIWNTLSGRKEELEKAAGRPLRLFVCGPTVYDYAHIGHARTYVVFDAFVRYLRRKGWSVFYLQNLTNVDDKIIVRAREENKNPLELARFFVKTYLDDMRDLGVISVDKYAPASGFIRDIERQIGTLREKGYAYEIPGDGIYYDISKFADYGKLSHRTAEEAEDGVSRIDESVRKRNRGDFCLWKFPKRPAKPNFFQNLRGFFVNGDGELVWKTGLGWGRPGWHIEDTAITEHYFGPQYDVHGAAADLKFPHHEAEIAQQEAASGKKPLVKIWMHAGFLTINGKKMSKSLKNFVSIRDALREHSSAVLRWFFLSAHYRTPMDYSPENLRQIRVVHSRVRIFMEKLDYAIGPENPENNQKAAGAVRLAKEGFDNALDDDFNTPLAIASLLGLIAEIQENLWETGTNGLVSIRDFLKGSFETLGIPIKPEPVPEKAVKMAAERELCRANKQFAQSDALREKIRVLGYSIEDTPRGPFVFKE